MKPDDMIDSEHLKALLTAGFFGSLVRLILKPEKSWQAWLAQIFVGAACAVFLGGAVSHVLNLGTAGMLASGFAIGTSAEHALAWIQTRMKK